MIGLKIFCFDLKANVPIVDSKSIEISINEENETENLNKKNYNSNFFFTVKKLNFSFFSWTDFYNHPKSQQSLQPTSFSQSDSTIRYAKPSVLPKKLAQSN